VIGPSPATGPYRVSCDPDDLNYLPLHVFLGLINSSLPSDYTAISALFSINLFIIPLVVRPDGLNLIFFFPGLSGFFVPPCFLQQNWVPEDPYSRSPVRFVFDRPPV